jgi:hypothetical protein
MMLDNTTATLAKWIPGENWRAHTAAGRWTVRLPHPDEAQFFFVLRGFETGEKRLEAQLFAEPEEWHRWVLSYEILNDDGSRADFRKLEKSFLTDVDHVLHNQTRVIVSNYVLARIFRCEYLSDGKWQTIGGPYPSPVNPELPGIRGWKRTYTSPPVTQILTQQPAVLTKVSA